MILSYSMMWAMYNTSSQPDIPTDEIESAQENGPLTL